MNHSVAAPRSRHSGEAKRWVGAMALTFVVGVVGWGIWAVAFMATSHLFEDRGRNWLEQSVVIAIPLITVWLSARGVAAITEVRLRWAIGAVVVFWLTVIGAVQTCDSFIGT